MEVVWSSEERSKTLHIKETPKMILTEYLKCPICSSPFVLSGDEKSLVCGRGHNFDLARQGYVNLCGGSMGKLYEQKELFQARRNVYEAGFFRGVEEAAGALLKELFPGNGAVVVEAGCGEGSFLSRMERDNPGNRYIGLDISKNAVRMAARGNPRISWLVADICKIPIKDGCIDCIIDMLTPANYTEFNRILKPGAYIMKIIPGDSYLRELRRNLGLGRYENKGVDSFFSGQFELLDRRQITYVFDCEPSISEDIYVMTPMSEKREEESLRKRVDSVTMDLTLMVGKVRK